MAFQTFCFFYFETKIVYLYWLDIDDTDAKITAGFLKYVRYQFDMQLNS